MGLLGKPNIAKLKARRDVEGLVKALAHKDHDARIAAADALGTLGDPVAAAALAQLLADEVDDVRATAVRGLQAAGYVPTATADRVRYLVCLGDWETLSKEGAAAAPVLVEELKRRVVGRSSQIVGAHFTRSGPEGDTHLFVEPPGPDTDGDVVALMAVLTGIGLPSVEPLIEALADEDAGQYASWTLVEIGEPALRPLLNHFLAQGSWPIRVRDERWLGGLPTTSAIARVVRDAGGSGLLPYVQEGASSNLEGLRLVAGIADDEDAVAKLDQLLDRAANEVEERNLTGAGYHYVDSCLEPAFIEEDEPRSWRSEPEFTSVVDALNRGDHRTAAKAVEKLVARYPDFDLVYYWWGGALRSLGELDRAREVLREGVTRGRRKYTVCGRLGELESAAGDLGEAVYWWTQAIHCQERLEGYGGEVGPYLHAHYVADGMEREDLAEAFLRRVDQIRPGEVRLEPSAAAEVRSLAARDGNSEIDAVLSGLSERYLR